MPNITLPHNHGHNEDYLIQHMPSVDECTDAAGLFSMLGDPSRLRIFWLLCHTEECVSNIAAAVEMSTSAASHHLKILQANQFVVSRRIGKEIHYTLAANNRAAFAHSMIESYFHKECPLAHCHQDE